MEVMQAELVKLRSTQAEVEEAIQKAAAGRQESAERVALIQSLSEAESLHKKYKAELEQYREFDPDAFDAKKVEVKGLKEGTNRWTDNIFTLQTFCSNQFNIARADFNSQFGLPEDLDYVE